MNKRILLLLSLSLLPYGAIYSMKLNFKTNKPKNNQAQPASNRLITSSHNKTEDSFVAKLKAEETRLKHLNTSASAFSTMLNLIGGTATNGIASLQSLEIVQDHCENFKNEFFCCEYLDTDIKEIKKLNNELIKKQSEIKDRDAYIENFNTKAKQFLIEINSYALATKKENAEVLPNTVWRISGLTKDLNLASNFQCNVALEAAKDLIKSYKELFQEVAENIKSKALEHCQNYEKVKNKQKESELAYNKKNDEIIALRSKRTRTSSDNAKKMNKQLKELGHELKKAESESSKAFALLVDFFVILAEKTLAFKMNKELKDIDANIDVNCTIKIFDLLAKDEIRKLFFEAQKSFENNPLLLNDLYLSMRNYLSLMSKKFKDPRNKCLIGIEWEIEVTYWIFNMLKHLGVETSSLRMNQHQKVTYNNNRTFSRELDIVSDNFLVECKNIDWDSIDFDSNEKKLKQQFIDQKKIARMLNKIFCIISKNAIKQRTILEFFDQEQIKFVDPNTKNQDNFLVDPKVYELKSVSITNYDIELIEQEINSLREQIYQEKARKEEMQQTQTQKGSRPNKKQRKKRQEKAQNKEVEINRIEVEINRINESLEDKLRQFYSNFNSLYKK